MKAAVVAFVTEHKAVVDWAAIATLLGAIAELLPPFATLLTIIVALIRIWETKTGKAFLYMLMKMFSKRKKRR